MYFINRDYLARAATPTHKRTSTKKSDGEQTNPLNLDGRYKKKQIQSDFDGVPILTQFVIINAFKRCNDNEQQKQQLHTQVAQKIRYGGLATKRRLFLTLTGWEFAEERWMEKRAVLKFNFLQFVEHINRTF